VRARNLRIPLETCRFLSSANRFQGVEEWFGERTQRSGQAGRKILITLQRGHPIHHEHDIQTCMYVYEPIALFDSDSVHNRIYCASSLAFLGRAVEVIADRGVENCDETHKPSIIPFPPRKSRPAQAPTTSGPCLRVEMLIRDAAPMRTMTRTRTARTMGRVFILASSLLPLSLGS
jgi:hypothetical protein